MFDNFGDSERWSYARTKTEGLSNPQKALQSLAPVPIVYFLVRDQGAIYRLAAALITWVVTYLLFPLIARGYYWWRAPLHLAEARIEELQKTVAELNGDLFNLTAQITRKQSNQDTANWLTQRHAYGVHELLNKRPASADADEWLYRIDQFTESVVEGLHERDASPQIPLPTAAAP